jgi:glycosyltransferase involved in cell wall biosynthesis
MKISFVIPAYNEEFYLGKCLKAILAQLNKRPDIESEIIVVNNASTDKTRDIALSFGCVKVIDEAKKGLVSARTAGYKAATGDLIANIDADTVMPDGWLDKVCELFSQDEEMGALSGPFIYYDLSDLYNFWVNIYYHIAYYWSKSSVSISRRGSILQGGNFIIRRTCFEMIGGFNPDFVFYGEDADVARRMEKVGKVVFSFGLPIYASGRRLQSEGMLITAGKYVINYFWTMMFKKPYSRTYADIRYKN